MVCVGGNGGQYREFQSLLSNYIWGGGTWEFWNRLLGSEPGQLNESSETINLWSESGKACL